MDPQRPSDVYAATYRGLYKSTDGGNHWMLIAGEISETNIRALALDTIGRKIYAGTSSQGVWVAPLDVTLDFHVNPWGAATILTSGTGEVRTGYADVATDPGNAPYGTAVFAFRQNGVLVSEAGVPASRPITSARVFVDYRNAAKAVPSRIDAGYVDIRTGIAVVNYSAEKANITYTLRDPVGIAIAVGQGELAPWHHVACFIDRLADCAVSNFTLPPDSRRSIQFGSLDISGDQPLSVLALRGVINQREEFLLTTTPVADLTQAGSADPLYFPQFVDGGRYTTSLILLNTSNATESGTLHIRDKGGNPLAVSQAGGTAVSLLRYSIPPNGFFRLQTDGSSQGIKAGWVQLAPDPGSGAPVGSGIFGYNPHSVLVSESGIPSAVASTKAYADLSDGHNTGLAISNTTDAESSVTIKAYGKDGISNVVSVSDVIPLAARGYMAGFADDFLKDLPAGFTGVLDVSSTTPIAALSLRSLTNERGEFLMTTFPVVDRGGTAPTPIIFPHIVDGGGYTTQFVFLSAGAIVDAGLILYDESGETFYRQ
jgi:hypothetical protein